MRFAPFFLLPLLACTGAETDTVDTEDTEDTVELAKYTLTFEGKGYDTNDGQKISVLVVQDGTLLQTGAADSFIAAAPFSFTFDEAITETHGYSVYYFIDVKEDSLCVAGDDTTGFVWFGEVAAAHDIDLTPGLNEPADSSCAVF